MNVEMTARVDGHGKITMETLAQAWDALTYTAAAPPEATVTVFQHPASGRWMVTAAWTPAEPDGAEPADRLADNLDAIRDELAQGLARGPVLTLPDEFQPVDLAEHIWGKPQGLSIDPQAVAEAVQSRHRGQGYLFP